MITQAGAGMFNPAVPSISASSVKSPASKVIVYEAHVPQVLIPYVGDWSKGWLRVDWLDGVAYRALHNQTHGVVSNFLFCDGHVASAHGDTLMDMKSHWYPRGVEQPY